MPSFQPRDPAFAEKVAAIFRDESALFHWGGEIMSVSPGVVELALPVSNDLLGPGGLLYRSHIAAMLDDACTLAALSLTSAGDTVDTAEYKLNFLAPGSGETLVARAEVVRPGRSISVCRAEACADGRLLAKMLATLAVSRPA